MTEKNINVFQAAAMANARNSDLYSTQLQNARNLIYETAEKGKYSVIVKIESEAIAEYIKRMMTIQGFEVVSLSSVEPIKFMIKW